MIWLGLAMGFWNYENNLNPKISTKTAAIFTISKFVQNISYNSNWVLILTTAVVLGIAPLPGIIVGMTGGLLNGIINSIHKGGDDFIQITQPYQRFAASIKVLHLSILQHLLLRYKLKKIRLIPWNLIVFLNNLSNCEKKTYRFTKSPVHLMESDGASWRFRHRLIQEWFAEKWKDESKK